jgi:hypothetical protein
VCTKVKSEAAVCLSLIKTFVKMSNVSLFNAPMGSFGQNFKCNYMYGKMYVCMHGILQPKWTNFRVQTGEGGPP